VTLKGIVHGHNPESSVHTDRKRGQYVRIGCTGCNKVVRLYKGDTPEFIERLWRKAHNVKEPYT